MSNDAGGAGIYPNDLATMSLAGIGGYGYRRGYGDPYASMATIQHGVEYNSQKTEDMADCNREIFKQTSNGINSALEGLQRDNQFQATNKNVSDGHARICDRMAENERRTSDMIFAQELRNGDRLRDLDREINANAREAAKCCCDLARQACEDKAQIIAEVKASESRGIQRDLDRAERELTALKTQVACGCTTGCSTPCHGHHGRP